MAEKTTKKVSFKEYLVQKIGAYTDQADATEDLDERQAIREAIHELEQLVLSISNLRRSQRG